MEHGTGVSLIAVDINNDYQRVKMDVEGRILCKCTKCGDEFSTVIFPILEKQIREIAFEQGRKAGMEEAANTVNRWLIVTKGKEAETVYKIESQIRSLANKEGE